MRSVQLGCHNPIVHSSANFTARISVPSVLVTCCHFECRNAQNPGRRTNLIGTRSLLGRARERRGQARVTDARLWHPWLRINRVLRMMLHTHWSAEAR
jgi:hypothetical protein